MKVIWFFETKRTELAVIGLFALKVYAIKYSPLPVLIGADQ